MIAHGRDQRIFVVVGALQFDVEQAAEFAVLDDDRRAEELFEHQGKLRQRDC